MSDQQKRSGIALQIRFQPTNGLGVEVVGGLVEEEEIGLEKERPSQRHALALSARERAYEGLGIGEAEAAENSAGTRLPIPPAGYV